MIANLVYAGVVFMGFFAIMNPLSGIPVFLSLTENDSPSDVRKIAMESLLTAFCVVFVFSVAGHFLLHFFGVSFTALRLAGGVLVALIGYEMLKGKPSSYVNSQEVQNKQCGAASISITPLGVPLLAGPGVIVTAMNFSSGPVVNLIITNFAFALLCVLTYFVFISGKKIKDFMGANALAVMIKMMGLILIVIGTQMLIEGVYSAIYEFNNVKYF